MSELEEKYEALKKSLLAYEKWEEKYEALKSLLAYEKVAVAFLGGVDSTFLLRKPRMTFWAIRPLHLPPRCVPFRLFELEEAKAFCKSEGIRLLVWRNERAGGVGICGKRARPLLLLQAEYLAPHGQETAKLNITNLLEGSNVDDLDDYRRGAEQFWNAG